MGLWAQISPPIASVSSLAETRFHPYTGQYPPLMEARSAGRNLFALILAAAFLAGTAADAATTRVQNQFLTGEIIPAPADGTANAAAISAARELQSGPRRAETPDLYGRRARLIAVSLGLSGPEAAKAEEFYRARAWTLAMKSGGGGLLRVEPNASRAALTASTQRARAAMRDPNWASAAPGALPVAGPPRVNWAEAKTPPLLTAPAPARKRVAVPAPAAPAPAQSLMSRLSFGLPEFLSLDREARISRLQDRSADYDRRARAITEKNTGDSASGWFRRQLLSAQSSFYAMGALVNDPSAMKRAASAAGESVVRGMFPDKAYAADHPGTWRAAIIDHLAASVDPKLRLLVSVSTIGAKKGLEDTMTVARAVERYDKRGSFWNAADAALAAGNLGLDIAGAVTPAAAARLAVREAASAPRSFLKTSGIRPDLAQTIETNYRRTAELEREYLTKKRSGAPAAELAALRKQSRELYQTNAVLQTEMPELREFFANAKPGDPASPAVMQVVAANMGTQLETVNGVRLANYTSLARDMKAGGVKPNPGKALDDGTLTGSGAHLMRDGSPHMVSVADRLTSGLVLLMTGYADAHRATKTMSGLMYEFEGVKNAARVPLSREVFSDVLTQNELMVPEVPLQNIKRVRSWRAEINPAAPGQLIFRYSEPLVAVEGLNPDALVTALKELPHSNTMRVAIPDQVEPFINR